jgi:MFS family permease
MADEKTTNHESPIDRYIAAFRYRDYMLVWLASLSGSSSYWALIVARGVLVLDLTGSAASVGIVTFAAMAPRFVVPPLAGYLADRFTRRTVLVGSYATNMILALALTALVFRGDIQVWHLMVLSTLNGAARTFQMTATQALVPNLIPRNILMNAVALNYATVHGTRLIGPGLLVPLMLFASPGYAFLGASMFYVVGFAVVLGVRTRSSGGIQKGQSLTTGLGEAIAHVYRSPGLRMLFLLIALHCSLTMAFESILPIYSRDVIGAGGAGVSYLMMGVGSGALVAVLIIAGVRTEWAKGRLLLLMGFFSGASLLGLALAPNLPLAILSAVFMGASQSSFMAISNAMVQSLSPDALRGRISGLNQINVGGTMAAVNLGNGFLADAQGPAMALYILGTSFMVIMALSLGGGTLRKVYIAGTPETQSAVSG